MYKSIFTALVFALLFAGCEKDVDQFVPDPSDPVQQVNFNASAFLVVTDADGNPVADASVRLDNQNFTTDDEGVLHMEDVVMHPATYLTVEKSGYFQGSRRFYPSKGKTSYIKVSLLSSQVIGNFATSSGGQISLPNGATLRFPSNAIAYRDGTPYDGLVDVSAQPITADDPNLSDKMPGDLVGVTDDGEMGALASLGMVVVELHSPSGELLNVREGSTVNMQMPVPAELLGKAPAQIPMWFFDEVRGVWNEDGKATLGGSAYTAEVSHFTYWNYDAWFPIVKWGATVLYADGSPASQVSVCITILDLETTKCSSTNEDGMVCGMVASGEVLLVEITDPCGNVILSEQIGPFSDTTITGPYTIPATNVTTTEVSGSVEDCDGGAVTNGFGKIKVGETTYYVDLEDDGTFNITLMNCDESDVTITAVDEVNLKQSLPQTFAYADVIDAGTIVACDDLQEFLVLNVDGFAEPVVFLMPTAFVVQQTSTQISTQDSTTNFNFFYMVVPGNTVGTYSGVFAEMSLDLGGGVTGHPASPLEVVFTYYGDAGDYIQGTLSGTVSDQPGGGGTLYPMTGSFSVLRN